MNKTAMVESVLTDSERAEVQAYVKSAPASRNKTAMRPIYLRALARGATPDARENDVHLQFLSELFSPAPDLGLRATLASRISGA